MLSESIVVFVVDMFVNFFFISHIFVLFKLLELMLYDVILAVTPLPHITSLLLVVLKISCQLTPG
jgi:hypothetical protein